MTAIAPKRNTIQVEETKYDAAVSESILSRVGAGINFINTRHVYQHGFNINGEYNTAPVPFYIGDGFITYPFAFEIIDVVCMTGKENGSGFVDFSARTTFDIKWRPELDGYMGGPAFQSIFSTLPSFNFNAPPQALFRATNGGYPYPFSGVTRPVLSKTVFAAYDYLVVQLLSAVKGPCSDASIQIFIRPIDA